MTLLEENAAVLKDLASDGLDLTASSLIEFDFLFTNEADAEGFAEAADSDELETIVLEPEDGEEEEGWEVLVTVELVPTAEAITEIEARLTQLAQDFHGEPDGWGIHNGDFAEFEED